MQLSVPTDNQFREVCAYIKTFELDDRSLDSRDFLAAFLNNELIGFGRIRNFETCSELCSLGVIESQRFKGIGKNLISNLIKQALQPLYLVCIIPEYFIPLGFILVTQYPNEIKNKLNYCTHQLAVPENYVVMKYDEST